MSVSSEAELLEDLQKLNIPENLKDAFRDFIKSPEIDSGKEIEMKDLSIEQKEAGEFERILKGEDVPTEPAKDIPQDIEDIFSGAGESKTAETGVQVGQKVGEVKTTDPFSMEGKWDEIPINERSALSGETKGLGLGEFAEGDEVAQINAIRGAGLEVNVAEDGLSLTIEGTEVSLETAEGLTTLSRVSEVAGAGAETAGIASSIASAAGGIGLVVGLGLLTYEIVNKVIEDNKKTAGYKEQGAKLLETANQIGDMNEKLRKLNNNSVETQNKYVQLMAKYYFGYKNPPKNEGTGAIIPPFEYEKDDKLSHYSDEQLQDKVFSLFYDPYQEQKYRNLYTMPRSTAEERKAYNKKDKELKTELSQYQTFMKQSIKILMEDKQVDKGGLISGGLNTRQRMEMIYKNLREQKQRHEYQDRLFGTTNWFYKQTGAEIPEIDQQKLIKMDLGVRDERVLRHFREQVFDSPNFNSEFITKKTNELNQKRINIVNQQYDIKVSVSKAVIPKTRLRDALIQIGKERVEAIKNATLTEYEVDNGYMNKNRTRIGKGLDITEPSWVDYYKKNKKKFLEDDFTAIRKSQIQWATGKQQIKNLYDDIVKQKERRAELKKNPVNPFTDQNNEWDNRQYGGWLSNDDIQRKPRHKPEPEPDKPVIPTPKPDDPPEPKPKPLPPHRKTGRRRLLGETNLEPQYDLPYDGDIKFDIEIAKHLLHLCEHSYERFDDSYFPSNDIFEYDMTGKFGDENFGTSEQARGYYSNEKNVLTIAFRGTDFGKVYTGRFDLFVADLIKDLSISPVFYDGLRVHSGFLQFYLSLKEQINQFFTNTRVNADTIIYTTGHSYGAIPAMILAYEINKYFKYKKCVCYTFGSPRGFDKESAKIVNSQLTSFRVADINDPITLLPPKAVAGQNYYHAGRTILLDGEILKEIKDNDEADKLFTISTISTLKFGAQLGVENVLISLLTGLETPSQITLAQRLSGYFQQFINPTNFPAMLENTKNFGAGLMRYMGFMQPTSRYGLRNTPERVRRQQIPNFIVSRRNNLFTEFFTKFPKAKGAFYKYDINGEDVLEIIKNEGLGESHMWEDGLVRKLFKKGVPRDATKSFLTTLEQLYFPQRLEDYKSWLDSYNVGFIQQLAPTMTDLKNLGATAGGIMAFISMIRTGLQIKSFIDINAHSLKTYNELLELHHNSQKIFGHNSITEDEILANFNSVKDEEQYTYHKVDKEFQGKQVYHQVNEQSLEFMPFYHADVGVYMQPIPRDIRQAVIGFIELPYDNRLPIKGLVAY